LIGLALTPFHLHAAKLAATSAPPLSVPAAAPQAPASPAPGSELKKLVERLSARSSLTAANCADLARQTIEYGQSVRQSGQPLKPGIVQDGLSAVDHGEQMDPQESEWPKLRSQLKELLNEPPKQDQKQDENKKEDSKQDQQKQDEKKSGQDNQQQQDKDKQEKQEQQKQQQEQEKTQEQSGQEQQQSEQKQDNSQPPSPQPSESAQAQPTPSPNPQNKDTQKIGGGKPDDKERREHPELAEQLQKLDEVRQKDSPAELYQLLQQKDPRPEGTPKKDW
jgi:Ca-activated chloride channel family protein